MRRLIAVALLVFAPFVVEGCHSDSATSPAQTADGNFALATVDGGPLPVMIRTGDPQVEVVKDEFVFTPTGTFTQVTTFRYTVSGFPAVEAHSEPGTYTMNGTAITFRFNANNSTVTGTLDGNTLTVTAPGHSLIYLRS